MFETFIEYMWYLFTTPFKKVRKPLNKWYILCQVLGRRFDEAKEAILRARDEGMVATCCHDMLPVHGADRGLYKYEGEHPENFRSRIAMYEEICKLGGTNEGILLAVKALGFEEVDIKTIKELYDDAARWAEFCIILPVGMDSTYPIGINILKKEVRKTKEVGAKDNYLIRIQGAVCSTEQFYFERIVSIFKFRWYGNVIWNGDVPWNGGCQWNSCQNNHPMHIKIKMHQVLQITHSAGLVQKYHYRTWCGDSLWDGHKTWDAEIIEEVL